MGYTMKKVATSVWTSRTIRNDEHGAKQAKTFIELFDANFHQRIGAQSIKNKNDKHASKKTVQIKDDDVKKLGQGYLHDIPLQEAALYENKATEDNYFALNDSLQGYLLALNRKRA